MNNLEDRLRDAYRGAAETIRPEAVRDLRLTGSGPDRALRALRAPRSRWVSVAMPLGAAAAVTALVLGALAIAPRAPGRLAPAGAASGSPSAPASPTGSGSGSQTSGPQMPRYAMLLSETGLVVVSTATGQVTARLAAPAGQAFTQVATADDRTFLVTADLNPQTSCRTFLYRVQLSGTGQPSGPAPFATSGIAGYLPTALAMSADGKTAAFSAVHCAGEGNGRIGDGQAIGGINLLDMTAGRVTRQWDYSLSEDYPSDLSLSADGGELAFTMYLSQAQTGVRVLTTSRPSGTVDSASSVVLRQPQGSSGGITWAQLSPDGGMIYACTAAGPPTDTTATLAAYSAATGQRGRVLHDWTPAAALSCRLGMDPSGSFLLLGLADTKDGQLTKPGQHPAGNPLTTQLIAVEPTTGTFTVLTGRMPGMAESVAW